MSVAKAKEIALALLPSAVIAGKYACHIQENVQAQEDKCLENDSPFTAALTDADLSIQNYIEMELLSKFPDIAFYGEEEASSLNSKYFPKDAEIKVLLDPIDGTLFYKNKLPLFSVMISICSREEYLATIIYQPALNHCFLTLKGGGTQKLSTEDMLCGNVGESVSLSPALNLITAYKCPAQKEILQGDYETLDFATDFTYEQNWSHDMVGILSSRQKAILTTHPLVIDSGVIAFAVKEAGGFISDFSGNELNTAAAFENGMYDTLLIAANEDIAQDILKKINV